MQGQIKSNQGKSSDVRERESRGRDNGKWEEGKKMGERETVKKTRD